MANDKQDKELRTRAEILREQVNVLLSRGKYTEASTAIFRELLKARRDGIADADRYAKAPMTNHPKFTASHDSAARSVGYEGARESR